MSIFGPINSGVSAGGAGISTNSQDSAIPLNGFLMGVYVRYNDTPPNTTDVIVKTKGTNAPSLTLLTLTNKNTDGWFFPRIPTHDNLGALVTGEDDTAPIDDFINVSIAQANDGDSVDVWLFLWDL